MGVSTGLTRVLMANDHATVREGIRRFLADTPDLVVAREAGTGSCKYSRPWQPGTAM